MADKLSNTLSDHIAKFDYLKNMVYQNSSADSGFAIPLPNGVYSGALNVYIFTRYGLFAVYGSSTSPVFSKIFGASDAERNISSVSYNSTTKILTVNFSGGMFGGIFAIHM